MPPREQPSVPKERPSASEAHLRTATTYRPSTRRYEARSLKLDGTVTRRGPRVLPPRNWGSLGAGITARQTSAPGHDGPRPVRPAGANATSTTRATPRRLLGPRRRRGCSAQDAATVRPWPQGAEVCAARGRLIRLDRTGRRWLVAGSATKHWRVDWAAVSPSAQVVGQN